MSANRDHRIPFLDSLRQPQAETPPSIEQLRAGFSAMMANVYVPPVSVEEMSLAGRRALSIRPEGARERGVVLYFHGGGFSYGTPETALGLAAELSLRTSTNTVSLEYRLAPEHPFPASLNDCLAAYREILASGVDASEVVVAGDSAGGNLAVTMCLAARAAGVPLPAGIVVFSPVTDLTRSGESIEGKAGIDPFFTVERFELTNAFYLNGHDPKDELVSPGLSADLTGFPALLIQVGTAEMLLDDSTRLAKRAWSADVDVILDVVANVPHVFTSMTGLLPEANEALERAAVFIQQRLRQ